MDVPVSVKNLLEQIKTKLEIPFSSVCVVGEVSNFRGSGRHWYFTLKGDGAAIQCVVWASQQRFIKCCIEDGKQMQIKGSLNLYVVGGTLTLVVTHCIQFGMGDFRARLLQLESELRARGLFDRPKRSIPRFPFRIGVVAAIGGAALRDVIQVTGRRSPGVHLLIFPASAQGNHAVVENLAALYEAQNNFWECDVILIVRGGGSLEDLWAYNDPTLVKAVADCSLPVITGVGHEIDFTLVDLAADLRAATPSQAAELATPDRRQMVNEIMRLQEALINRIRWQLQMSESALNLLVDSKGMNSVSYCIDRNIAFLDKLNCDMARCEVYIKYESKLRSLVQRLHLTHPQRHIDLAVGCLNIIQQKLLHVAATLGKDTFARRLSDTKILLYSKIDAVLSRSDIKLNTATAKLSSMNPNGPMELGFVLVSDSNGRLVTRSSGLSVASKVKLCWLDGSRVANVED